MTRFEVSSVGSFIWKLRIRWSKRSADVSAIPNLKWIETYLHSALDNIQRTHDGVGDTAGEDTSNHAFLVVTKVVYVRHL